MAFDFTYTVGFLANTEGLKKSVRAFEGELKGNPLKLSTVLPDISTTSAQKALDAFRRTGVEITGVTAKMETLKGKSGQTLTQVTGLTVGFINSLGRAGTAAIGVANNIQRLKGGEKALQALNKEAAEWSAKAQSMNTKDKIAIMGLTTSLQEQIKAYEKLTLKRKASAGGIEKYESILATAQALRTVTDATGRSAVGLQGWVANLQRAFSQTMSYAATLGILRTAYRAVTDAIKYAIELNKEMIKVQLLQVEGAQSAEEIRSLAKEYNELATSMGVTTLEVARGSVEWFN